MAWLYRCSIALATGALAAGGASAQVAFVPVDVLGTAMSGAIMDAARVGTKPDGAKPSAPPRADAGVLHYVPTPDRTRANVAAFADKSRAVDPKGADALVQLFASTDVMAAVEIEMRKVGMTRANLADAYTIWWTNAWLGAQGRNEELPAAQMQAVKRQTTAALLATPQVVAATDATKQELAEALLIQAMLIGASVDAAKAQPALMAQTKDAIAKGAQGMGIDLRAMTLTETGFVPQKK